MYLDGGRSGRRYGALWSQFKPPVRPSPVTAEQDWMCHDRSVRECRPILSDNWATGIAHWGDLACWRRWEREFLFNWKIFFISWSLFVIRLRLDCFGQWIYLHPDASSYEDEQEVLFPPGYTWSLVSVETPCEIYRIFDVGLRSLSSSSCSEIFSFDSLMMLGGLGISTLPLTTPSLWQSSMKCQTKSLRFRRILDLTK